MIETDMIFPLAQTRNPEEEQIHIRPSSCQLFDPLAYILSHHFFSSRVVPITFASGYSSINTSTYISPGASIPATNAIQLYHSKESPVDIFRSIDNWIPDLDASSTRSEESILIPVSISI